MKYSNSLRKKATKNVTNRYYSKQKMDIFDKVNDDTVVNTFKQDSQRDN